MAVGLVSGFFLVFFGLGLSRLTRSLDCPLKGKSQPGPSPEHYHGGMLCF